MADRERLGEAVAETGGSAGMGVGQLAGKGFEIGLGGRAFSLR